MKILVAYDDSDYALAVLHDLLRAGIPPAPEVVVATVSDNQSEASEIASRAAQLLQLECPEWNVRAEGLTGSPAPALIERADSWAPDLLAVGSHGRTAFGRFLLGSVSHKLASEARCSVRVVRRPERLRIGPPKIVVGADGSASATAAVKEVASRHWPQGVEVVVVTAVDVTEDFENTDYYEQPAMQVAEWKARQQARRTGIADSAVDILRSAGLAPSLTSSIGSPKKFLIEVANVMDADCIFLGASGAEGTEDDALGSAANFVVMRASCSVEIVRK